MPLPLRVALAALSGLAVSFGFAPYDRSLLGLLGLVGLVASLRGAGTRAATGIGFAFGVVFMAALMPWLRVIGTDAWLGLAAAEGLFYALFGWAFAVTARSRWWPLAATCCWVAMEFARSVVPFGGFPWGRLAFATTDTPLAGYARWIGVPALSGLVFGLACLLVLAWAHRARLRPAAGALAGVVALIVAGLLLPVGLADRSGDVTVAVIQGDVPGTGADGLGQQEEVLRNHADLTQTYADRVAAGTLPAADLVLWPENSSDIDPFASPGAEELIDDAVRAAGVPTLVGTILDGPRAGTAENVSIVWDPVTGAGDRYVKRRLVPFGEYIPYRSVVARYISRLDQIPRDMVPGEEPGLLQVGPALVGTMLCFDVAYDDNVRDVAGQGAEFLVVQTNNATYLGTGQPEQQWAISRMRAIEAGKSLVVASTNGISGVVAADGDVVTRSGSGRAQILVERVQLGDGVTLGVRIGGFLEYAASLAAVVLVVIALVQRRRERRRGVGDGPPLADATSGPPPAERELAGRAPR